MGRQIQFFMTGEDEALFLESVADGGGVFLDRRGQPLTSDDVMGTAHVHELVYTYPFLDSAQNYWADVGR
ncbi:MAG: hypothetical protein LBG71_02015 [Clostridiales Family XIII bacterium]|jgi:hypothetical protein|nr:hypothetical protein [Clostridiales Family XIII bacterium]